MVYKYANWIVLSCTIIVFLYLICNKMLLYKEPFNGSKLDALKAKQSELEVELSNLTTSLDELNAREEYLNQYPDIYNETWKTHDTVSQERDKLQDQLSVIEEANNRENGNVYKTESKKLRMSISPLKAQLKQLQSNLGGFSDYVVNKVSDSN